MYKNVCMYMYVCIIYSTVPIKGVLDDILKFSFLLNFTYHTKITNFTIRKEKKNKNSFCSESEKDHQFLLSMHNEFIWYSWDTV